ncbi:MAG: squalene synthase HpnC [Planctomycetes bacterium]|nr:squalene synthase HpnC [Planctomycetota bacterium]
MVLSSPASADRSLQDPRHYLALAQRHYENFPVGSWLLPRAARLHLRRIYAFARTADDLADERRDAAALAAFRRDFLRHVQGQAGDVALFVDLVATMHACDLEPELFTDLLDAFAQDLEQGRYDEPGLFDYCSRSADPVGRLVLRVCGYRDAALDALSDRICTALQLLNHLQDVGSDLRDRDRIYLPQEDLHRFGVGEAQLRAASADPPVRALVRHWADRIAGEFAAGWPLVDAVSGRLRWELRAILRGAAAVLRRIRSVDFDVLGRRTQLGKLARLGTVLGGLCLRRPPRFGGGAR